MNEQIEGGERGGPYVPSARKSIHNHDRCIFSACQEMGRYGLKSDRDIKANGSTSSHDPGIDEPDNVMSKPQRHTSPVPVRNKINQRKERRNSLNISDPEFSEDDEGESNLLAKSLPANLPSYYCSNDTAHRSQNSNIYTSNISNASFENKTSPKSVNKSNEYNRHNKSTSASSEKSARNNQSSRESGKSCVQIIIPFSVAIFSVAAALYYSYFINPTQGTETNKYDELRFNKDVFDLGEKYKINDNSILELQSGISTIIERNDSGSFIFIYNGKSMNFNYLQFSNFMLDIAATVARFLRNDTTPSDPTILHSSELDMESHSEFMTKYRHEVAKTGVMLIKEVDKIPSSLAMAFHYFCDEYNPLVAKSAIFFTLNLANCSDSPENKPSHNDVEKCLANTWKAVPKDSIKPLLARVVNVIVDVTEVH